LGNRGHQVISNNTKNSRTSRLFLVLFSLLFVVAADLEDEIEPNCSTDKSHKQTSNVEEAVTKRVEDAVDQADDICIEHELPTLSLTLQKHWN
jgi:hypothetical protein